LTQIREEESALEEQVNRPRIRGELRLNHFQQASVVLVQLVL
jgi:hypothetical protein